MVETISLLMQILLWPLCLGIVGMILLQGGAGDISSAFGGGGMLDSTLGVGASKKMAKVTGYMAGIFFLFVLFLAIPHKGGYGAKAPAPVVGTPDQPAVIVPAPGSEPSPAAPAPAPTASAPVLQPASTPVLQPAATASEVEEAAKQVEDAANKAKEAAAEAGAAAAEVKESVSATAPVIVPAPAPATEAPKADVPADAQPAK